MATQPPIDDNSTPPPGSTPPGDRDIAPFSIVDEVKTSYLYYAKRVIVSRPLPAGQTRSFVWRVTPVVAGSHTVRYRVAAGLNGRARAQTPSGDDPSGVFRVMVSRTPAQATVDPKTGDVVTSSP